MPTYFIQCGADGPVKIGFAKDPRRRMHNLQIGSVERLRLVGVALDDEASLHRRFSHLRISGEWFDAGVLSQVDITPIDARVTGAGVPTNKLKSLRVEGDQRDVRQLIRDGGGYIAISLRCGLGPTAAKQWPRIGIPEKHWPVVMEVTGASAEELHVANRAARDAAA